MNITSKEDLIIGGNMLNKEIAYMEDSIKLKQKEIESVDRKFERLLSQCENLKYGCDIRLNANSQLRAPFVFDDINIQKFTDKYYEVMDNLSLLISSSTYLYSYVDISNHKDFIAALVKCLSKCCTLCNEYNRLLHNIKGSNSNVEHDSKKAEINHYVESIIRNLVQSSWNELEGLSSLKIEGFEGLYTPLISELV